MSEKATVVSITPAALSADSRTLKMAVSLANAGYRSIVAEGRPSGKDFSASGIEIVPLYQTPSAGRPRDGSNIAEAVRRQSDDPNRGRSLVGILFRSVRGLYRAIMRTPLAPMRDLVTLYLHLKALWVSVGPAASSRLPKGDLYYVHAMDFAPAVWIRTVFRRERIIYDAHDMYEDLLLTNAPDRFVCRYVRRINNAFEKWLVHKACLSITTSQAMADSLERKYGKRFEVIRNLHDCRIDAVHLPSLRERLKLPANADVFVSIGNVKEGHRFENIARELAEQAGRIHLVGVGGGYDQLVECFRRAGAGDYFHFTDRLPAQEVVPSLVGADAAILPYVPCRLAYEVFLPNGFGQAIAAGLPLLYPKDIREVAHLAQANRLGWPIDPTVRDSVSRAVSKFLDPIERAKAVRQVANFSKEFNWGCEEKKFLKLIEQALPT